MHALVTGGGGFLGAYIVEALVARGDRVRAMYRQAHSNLKEAGVEVVRGDVRHPDAVISACLGVDCVFHVAAVPGIRMDARLYDETNRIGTENVIAACRRQGVARLIYTSSPSVVFAGRDQAGIDESAPYDFAWMKANRAFYSLSKAHGEQAVLTASGEALRTCALRPHLIWGPGDRHLIPRLLDRARSGRLRRVGDGSNLVDITYVENAVDAHLLAADGLERPLAEATSPAGKAYFISQGEPVNCWKWIDEVLALVDLPAVAKSVSLEAASRMGWLCEGMYRLLRFSGEPPMTRFLARQLATSHWFDISAARRDLAYKPRVSTEDGMWRLGEWLQRMR
jgi:nucleoside-diphosphate-sugar epimerase